MAGFLESIGSGLRQGGLALAGGMSNEVFREQGQAIAQRKQDEQRRRAQVAETMLRAVHSGQVAPDKIPLVRDAMARLGYDIPIDVLGPTPEAREKLEQYARGKEERRLQSESERDIENLWEPREGLGTRGGLDAATPPLIPRTNVQTFPLAPPDRQIGAPVPPQEPPALLDQADLIDSVSNSYNPDYPDEYLPTDQTRTMKDGEMGQLATGEIVGRRPAPGAAPENPPVTTAPPAPAQDMVPGPMGGMVPKQLADKWEIIVRAKNRGVPVAGDLFKQLLAQMYPGKGDFVTVGEGQTLVDPITGKAVFQGQPKTSALTDVGKLIQERAAMMAADPANPMIAKYDEAIGEASARKSAASSDLGKLIKEREALALSNPDHPMLGKYDETIKNYKQAANVKDDTFKNANVLRDEFNTHSKTFASMAQARRQIIEAARDPTAAGDLSLLYGYMKSLDPNSVVRESEFAMAAQAGSLPERIQGWATKLINGERLPDKIRNDFVNQSAKLYDAAVVDQEKLTNRYRGIAQRNNIPEIDVVGDFGTESRMVGASQPAAKAAGTKKTMTIKSGKDAGEYYQENGKWYKK